MDKPFKLNSTQLTKLNGDCGLTVMTSGCGPLKEGSTPSFTYVVFDNGTECALVTGLIHASLMMKVKDYIHHGVRVSNSRECS